MSTQLSININKFALIRNSRDENRPNLLDIAHRCIQYGGGGITVHPRPDQRHIRYSDLTPLSQLTKAYESVEFNIEGYPSDQFLKKIFQVKPDQVTFVPDPPDALTSSFGWNLKQFKGELSDLCNECQKLGIRSSLFISPELKDLDLLHEIKPDRVELYTYDYAHHFSVNKEQAISPYKEVIDSLSKYSYIGINAGHDLNQDNLAYFLDEIPVIKEVSIGHALVCESIFDGLEHTIKTYSRLCYGK